MKYIFKLLLVLLLFTGSLFAQENLTIPPYDNRLDKYPNTMMWYNTADKLTESAYNIALTYDIQIEDYKLAELWYKQALNLDSNNADAANNLGLIYAVKNDYTEAKKYYLIAAKFNHKSAMYNLARLYDKQKNNKSAIKWYKKAIERESLDAMKNLSLLYYSQKKYIQAVEYMLPLSDKKYTKKKVFALFRTHWKFSEATIKKGYEAQLKSTIIPEKLKYKGGI